MTNTKPDKKGMQETQQIFHLLGEVVEMYPKFPVAQHLAGILRRKDVEGKEFFFWDNAELLKKIEKYKDELDGEELMNTTDDTDD